MAILLRLIFPLLIVAGGIFAWVQLKEKAPPDAKQKPERELPVVTVRALDNEDFTVQLRTQGIVRAHDSGSLTSRVAGQVIAIHPSFETGAFFQKGEVLLELDTSDFQAQVVAGEARVARAKATLAQEVARGQQALLNWQDLGYTEPPSDLVLRKPQLAQAEAELASADAALETAMRDLARCKVVAPYNGRVANRLVSLGQAVGALTPLGEIFSTDLAIVRLPLDSRQLGFVTLPERQCDAALPALLADARADSPHRWSASVVRTEGSLDDSSRQLFVIAEIVDPFGIESGLPPLRIGQPITATIEGETLQNVFVIEREHLRNLDQVILIEADEEGVNRIRRRSVTPLWSDETLLVTREGFTAGEQLAVGPIAWQVEGGAVIVEPAPETNADATPHLRVAAPDEAPTTGA